MGCLKLTYQPQLKALRTRKTISSHEAKVVQLWHVVDPDAGNSRRWSPYNYAVNNPISVNDPFGLDTTIINSGQAFPAKPSQGGVVTVTNPQDGSSFNYVYDPKNPDAVNGYVGTGGQSANNDQDDNSVTVTSSPSGSGFSKYVKLAAVTLAVGGGPEDPFADVTALGELAWGAVSTIVTINAAIRLNAESTNNQDSKTAEEIIQKERKGSINREFPDQYRKKTLKEIEQAAKTDREAKKALKLLKDGRFKK